MKNIKKTGFTLVELLVVISIIALMLSILLPSLSKARELSKNIICASNLRSLGHGEMAYVSEWNGRLPMADAQRGGSGLNNYYPWVYAIAEYIGLELKGGSSDAFVSRLKGGIQWKNYKPPGHNVLFCPFAPGTQGPHYYVTYENDLWEEDDGAFCFTQNQPNFNKTVHDSGFWVEENSYPFSRMPQPSEHALLSDGWKFRQSPTKGSFNEYRWDRGGEFRKYSYAGNCTARHKVSSHRNNKRGMGKANVLFFDFHIDMLEVFDLTDYDLWSDGRDYSQK